MKSKKGVLWGRVPSWNHENNTNNEYEIIWWNCRSIKDMTKRMMFVDMLETKGAEIGCLMETFLTEEDPMYVKGWRIYRSNNQVRRKGVAIFIKTTIDAEIAKVAEDQEGRYVKVRIKNKITREVRTIACVYLEPTGDLRWIPENIIGSDIVVGDFNSAEK